MKNFLVLLVTILSLGLAAFTFADNGCPLTGYTYFLELDEVQYELSGFDCTFGPGCCADCDLWYGDFDTGPLYHERLPFRCYSDGSVTIDVWDYDIICGPTSEGDLECILVDSLVYKCYKLGSRTWCVPGGGVTFDLEQE